MRRLLVLVVLVGCNNDGTASDPQRTVTPRQLAGVYAEQWRCDSVASIDVLGQLLRGTVRQVDSAMPVPTGVPRPCTYQVRAQELEYWTFDVDCRDNMKQTADALFAQYRESSRETVQRFARVDAGVTRHEPATRAHEPATKAHDAGAEAFKPQDAVEVDVGAKGLDHHGRGVIFIDDDAPCYVRVTGKDAVRRLELARLIAKNLTFANAPMTPRAFR